MSPNVVQEKSDFIKNILQAGGAVNVELPDHRFEATKETLDLSVEPWGANRNGLFTNSDQIQKYSKQPVVEH
jgi:hypothetical protein